MKYIRFGTFIVLIIIFWSGIRYSIAPPATFPVPYRLTIETGQTLFSISHELADAHAIRSSRMFEIFMIALGSERRVSDGEYYFETPVSSLQIALRMSGRQFGIDRTKVTFPEGFTNKQIAERLAIVFPGFDPILFLTLAKGTEGYLFPDTYGFFPSVTPDFAIAALKRNFSTKVDPLNQDIEQSGRTLHDIMVMASIVEKEAAGDSDRAVVAGILWKRFDTGLALQVDAPFLYILGKQSSELTRADLAINSPYNTYRNKGLPPTPIGNPGLASIKATIHPQSSPYLYYLHDKDGLIHYAATYAEHKKNIAKYLN